jgi:hypothetical protein
VSTVYCLTSCVCCLLSAVFCPMPRVFCLLYAVVCLLSAVLCRPVCSSTDKAYLTGLQKSKNFLTSAVNCPLSGVCFQFAVCCLLSIPGTAERTGVRDSNGKVQGAGVKEQRAEGRAQRVESSKACCGIQHQMRLKFTTVHTCTLQVPAELILKQGAQASCLLSAVCCLLSAVCCLLSAVCCLLSAVCCLLSAACCLLSAVCCLLSAVCCLLSAVCCLLPALCSLLPAVCCLLSAACSLLSAACCLLSAVCCLLSAVYCPMPLYQHTHFR